MFAWPQNKFADNYSKLIESAKSGKWDNGLSYYETHHILPRCFGGWNVKENLVKLPAKYHYFAHFWLARMFPKNTPQRKSMLLAFHRMNSGRDYQNRYIDGNLFHEVREALAFETKGKKRILSDEARAKMREANGRPKSESHKANLRIAAQNRPRPSDETNKKRTAHRLGTKDSVETKEKRAAHHRGAKRSEQARANMREGRRLAKLNRIETRVA